MITVVTEKNRAECEALMRDLFTVRYELFVEGRGWRALARPDKLDIDAYDTSETVYIIKQIDGVIVGGARLRPTVVPHMLDEVFGDLCEGGHPPIGPNIYECSRTFVARRHKQRASIFAEVLLTAAEYCVTNGIVKLTGILEPWWLNSYLRLGLNAMPLGMPQATDDMTLLAVAFDVDEVVRNSLKRQVEALRRAGVRRVREVGHAA